MIFNTVIKGGGAGETVVEAKAVGVVTGAVEDDKVILIPTDIITSSELVSGSADFANSASNYMFSPGPRLDLEQVQGYFASTYEGSNDHSQCFSGIWNDSRDAFASTSTEGFNLYCINYKDDVPFAAQVSRSDSYQILNSIGFYQSGQYTSVVNVNNNYGFKGKPFLYVDKHFAYAKETDSNISIGTITENAGAFSITINRDNFAGYGGVFPVKYNGNWYYHCDGQIIPFDSSGSSYSLTYPWNRYNWYLGGFSIIDDNVDYIFVIETDYRTHSGFYRINKGNSTWTVTKLDQATDLISEAIQGGLSTRDTDDRIFCDMQTKDYGDYVDIIMATSEFGYNSDNQGNKLAHFIFTKATETLERLPDIFKDVDQSVTNYTRVCTYQVNWDYGFVSISLAPQEVNPKRLGVFVKKINDFAGVYKYYAVENVKENYLPSKTITGFVKENEGANELGDVVLKVKTAEDPDYVWTNIGVVFGMNVTVNEGEPV